MVSRKLPAYLLGRFPHWRIGAASYSTDLANNMGQDVRRNLASPEHKRLFPEVVAKGKYDLNRIGEFTAPGGDGSYLGVGIGSGLTGRPIDIGIIDDPTKDQQEALSPVTKESHWNWYQSVFTTRMSECSGQIIMATSWAEDDLPGRIATQYADDGRLLHLRFPAINLPDESGYDPELPEGALVPELHSLEKLYETKRLLSDYWWSAMYQQRPKALGGNVFKEIGVQYYMPNEMPKRFDKVVDSWDCTFKDTDGTDYVVGQKWGKTGANSYLLPTMVRARMGFVATADSVEKLQATQPFPHSILIEDKANGPAVIDFLKRTVARLLPVEPDGSKLARAHAVTSIWEARNIFLPHPDWCPWVKALVSELTGFPATAHDDQVDALTQALRYLYPLFNRLKITDEVLKRAMMR
jgi:predicted phage terminase large subunit-like protein